MTGYFFKGQFCDIGNAKKAPILNFGTDKPTNLKVGVGRHDVAIWEHQLQTKEDARLAAQSYPQKITTFYQAILHPNTTKPDHKKGPLC